MYVIAQLSSKQHSSWPLRFLPEVCEITKRLSISNYKTMPYCTSTLHLWKKRIVDWDEWTTLLGNNMSLETTKKAKVFHSEVHLPSIAFSVVYIRSGKTSEAAPYFSIINRGGLPTNLPLPLKFCLTHPRITSEVWRRVTDEERHASERGLTFQPNDKVKHNPNDKIKNITGILWNILSVFFTNTASLRRTVIQHSPVMPITLMNVWPLWLSTKLCKMKTSYDFWKSLFGFNETKA